MAIVIEQERTGKGGTIRMIIWIAILLVIVVGAYFLFFKHPDVIPNLATPTSLKDVNSIATVKLDPDAVVQSPAFQSLKPQAPDMPAPQTGRPNPFQP
jgi:hypothetical protein